ncbi:ComEC/Rec2 family competence protein [Spirosoma koreense]
MQRFQLILIGLLTVWVDGLAQQVGQPFPVWQPGELAIHHINTGQGNATFVIFPEGTTLLVDAGAINSVDWRTNKPRNILVKPTNERQAGEWIARYVRNALHFQKSPAIDYALITHFHDDHMGTPLNVGKRSANGYVLSGITEVGEHIPIRTILDRGWPDYNYPRPMTADSMVSNYRRFLNWHRQHKGLKVERFQAGRTDQIISVNKPDRQQHPFEVINLAVNGQIRTGEGSATRFIFPDLSTLQPTAYPNENMCSAVFQIRYGRFDYFSGGDIQGVLQFGAPAWHDVETPIAGTVDSVDVQLIDHHGYADSQNGSLLARLRPRVFVLPAWASSHPAPDVLERIYSEQTYKGERDVFAVNLLDEAKTAIRDFLPRLKSQSGHVVIRVDPGGATYRIFILADDDESFTIKAIHGPYRSR